MIRLLFNALRRISAIAVFSSLALTLSAQQTVTVTGVVTDENGEPLPGATVLLKGSTRGSITGADGAYSITVTSDAFLDFSFVGYETQSIAVGNQRKIDVKMLPKAEELEGATVVAFGTQKKASVVSSVETVKIKDLKVASSNLTSALAGRIPGIISYQTSGEPGKDNAQFFVRGVTTFGYKQNPLIMIDGFEATSDDLARLQIDDLESFSVLKDASATAVYGARGANGIIIINTKQGHEGPARVQARVDVNVATPTKIPQYVDAITYMRLYNEAQISRNPLMGNFYNEQKIQSTINGENDMIYPNVDWYHTLFRNYTINTKANLNISGGGKIATYYVAGGYEHENGLLKVDERNNFNSNISINRFHLRNNVEFTLSPTTKLDTRLAAQYIKSTGPSSDATGIFGSVMASNPVDFPAVFRPDAANLLTTNTLFGNAFRNGGFMTNPYADMVKGYTTSDNVSLSVQATLMQDLKFITEGLKFQAKMAVSTVGSNSSTRNFSPYYYAVESYDQVTEEYKLICINQSDGNPYLGDAANSQSNNNHYYFEGRANWDRKFGQHTVGAMVVGTVEEQLASSGGSIFSSLPQRNAGVSGRFSYDYDTRYFIEYVFGYNGSEKFTGEKRYGFFPSYGAGWIVSNEKWMNWSDRWLSNLKFKFTWGRVGNDAIAGLAERFFFLSDVGPGGYGYHWGETLTNEHSGYQINRYANPDISWEVSTKYNIGFELGLFKDFNLQVDYFAEDRTKIYMAREGFPATAGLMAPVSGNVGEVETHGIDASADLQHYFSPEFWLTGRINFTYSTNKIIRIDEKNYPFDYLKREGRNINLRQGYVAERLFVDDAEIANSPKQDLGSTYMAGDIKYTDVNNDGQVDKNDQIYMGLPTVPEMQFGFGLSAGYKKFDFSFFFQGNARTSFYIAPDKIAPFYDRRNALDIVANDYWTTTDPDTHAFWPRLSTTNISNNTVNSSWWMRSGGFLRLKQVEIGYNIDLSKYHVQNMRVYASSENLFVVSPFKLWDPEQGDNGLGYPLQRRFNVGILLQF